MSSRSLLPSSRVCLILWKSNQAKGRLAPKEKAEFCADNSHVINTFRTCTVYSAYRGTLLSSTLCRESRHVSHWKVALDTYFKALACIFCRVPQSLNRSQNGDDLVLSDRVLCHVYAGRWEPCIRPCFVLGLYPNHGEN